MKEGMPRTKAKKAGRTGRVTKHPVPSPADPLTAELDRRLLALGGQHVIHQQPDPRVADLLARGRVFDLPVAPAPGEPHDCHANAAALWARDTATFTLVTGFALVGGAWFAHSWVVDAARIYETTVRFDRYFGTALGEDDAAAFWSAHYLSARYPGPMAILHKIGQRALAEDRRHSPATHPVEVEGAEA